VERDKPSRHPRMGHWVRYLSRFFADVDGQGIGDQSGFSMAHRFIFTEHDFGWVDLLAIEGKEVIFRFGLPPGQAGIGDCGMRHDGITRETTKIINT
jgi:hypothetical protein